MLTGNPYFNIHPTNSKKKSTKPSAGSFEGGLRGGLAWRDGLAGEGFRRGRLPCRESAVKGHTALPEAPWRALPIRLPCRESAVDGLTDTSEAPRRALPIHLPCRESAVDGHTDTSEAYRCIKDAESPWRMPGGRRGMYDSRSKSRTYP